MSANERQVGGEHYKTMPIQPWDLMELVMSPEEFRGFLKGNIIKYTLRAGRKAGATDDADKAKHYYDKYLEVTEIEDLESLAHITQLKDMITNLHTQAHNTKQDTVRVARFIWPL